MSGPSRYLHPTTPGALLSAVQGLLTAHETLIVQAIESGTYFIFNEVPVGAINGSNKIFTLTHSPSPVGSEEVYLQGQLQKSGASFDYTISGATITFAVAPVSGSVIWVNYINSP